MAKAKNVPTKARLARELGVSYYTLVTRYWHLPGRPKDNSPGSARYNVQAYKNWISGFKSAHNFGTGHNGESNGYSFNERELALIEKNKIAAQREKFKLEQEMGEYIPRVATNRTIEVTNAATKRELYKMLVFELPPRTEMLKAIEIRRINEAAYRRIVAMLPEIITKVSGNGVGT